MSEFSYSCDNCAHGKKAVRPVICKRCEQRANGRPTIWVPRNNAVFKDMIEYIKEEEKKERA